MDWFFPVLLVAVLIWTVIMWSRLEKIERWVSIITLVVVAYAIFR